jgi:hypothetical protein
LVKAITDDLFLIAMNNIKNIKRSQELVWLMKCIKDVCKNYRSSNRLTNIISIDSFLKFPLFRINNKKFSTPGRGYRLNDIAIRHL